VHETVTEAVLRGRRLKIKYLKPGAGPDQLREHEVSPLGLVQQGAVFYVPVYYYEYTDVRKMALHRIKQAELLDKPSKGWADFDLEAWIKDGGFSFGGTEPIKVRLRFYENRGELLIEAPLAKDQQIELIAPGVHEVQASVINTEQFKRWLLGYDDKVEVLEPAGLRDHMRATLQAAARRYEPAAAADAPITAA
jgi:predicted DNA-binding transcriptional regulator YafY